MGGAWKDECTCDGRGCIGGQIIALRVSWLGMAIPNLSPAPQPSPPGRSTGAMTRYGPCMWAGPRVDVTSLAMNLATLGSRPLQRPLWTGWALLRL